MIQEKIFQEDVSRFFSSRRSVRKYLNTEIASEDIMSILTSGIWAPSPGNVQPWRFIIINKKNSINRLAYLITENLHSRRQTAEENNCFNNVALIRASGKYALAFKSAPLIIALVGKSYKKSPTGRLFGAFFPDKDVNTVIREEMIKCVSMAAQNMLLCINYLGLGGCALSAPIYLAGRKISEELQIGLEEELVLLISVGHYEKGQTEKRFSSRKKLENVVSWL
ncbi:nitroreductase [Sporomusaceae bacterium BoRhaA]|uniref:nitroreductase family protein n=1 Tax=Pelorhabdus rhamnosifermentans TaxID=2772457 RepID=UPI001C05EE14|nr:nitroreductase family protein [Pelorhabdus rhamnosifermentans]MBU2699717.1 nitroreductase [Pelorhabdus rhamnosifermentans]